MKHIIKHNCITGITSIKKFKFCKINKFNLLVLILILILIGSNIYQYKALKRQFIINVKIINNLNDKERKINSLQKQIDDLNNILIKNNNKLDSKHNNTKKD